MPTSSPRNLLKVFHTTSLTLTWGHIAMWWAAVDLGCKLSATHEQGHLDFQLCWDPWVCWTICVYIRFWQWIAMGTNTMPQTRHSPRVVEYFAGGFGGYKAANKVIEQCTGTQAQFVSVEWDVWGSCDLCSFPQGQTLWKPWQKIYLDDPISGWLSMAFI